MTITPESLRREAMTDAARHAAREFAIPGRLTSVRPHERGHIHDTFISSWQDGDRHRRYLHQMINDRVFIDVPALMHNIERVTGHLLQRSERTGEDDGLHTLCLVCARDGLPFVRTDSGPWRTYAFVENTETHDLCRGEQQAFDAARAFGQFQARLDDLDAGELRETIPNFFSSPHRLRQFAQARAGADPARARRAGDLIRFADERAAMVDSIDSLLASGRMPTRIVHGDTKLNNVLFDSDTGKPVCIVDLDTCMPAYSLYDFGDLVRFTAATSAEDETELDRVGIDLGLYRALVQGYLEGTASFLTGLERRLMPFAARLVTFTIGLRFLSDYLVGDTYFKVARAEQNLDRARVQMRMVEDMERCEAEMTVD